MQFVFLNKGGGGWKAAQRISKNSTNLFRDCFPYPGQIGIGECLEKQVHDILVQAGMGLHEDAWKSSSELLENV